MAMWERRALQNACPKGPSFSSSLLDSIYRSIDETRAVAATDHRKPPVYRRNKLEDDLESLRRAIMIEKWIDNYSTPTTTTSSSSACRSTPRHIPSNSASSTDSSVFSSSETDSSSASKTSPKSKLKTATKKPDHPPPTSAEGRFSKTKTTAQKIYGDLKKAKEPISPGGKISSFFSSIFSPRNSKAGEFSSSMRKSRSMKEAATCSIAASRSCLSKNASSRGSKSKRTVRFCPVSVILDQDKNGEIIKKGDFRVFEAKNLRKHQVKELCRDEKDLDDMSCASSDLFELENIGRVEYEQELPLYETTRVLKFLGS